MKLSNNFVARGLTNHHRLQDSDSRAAQKRKQRRPGEARREIEQRAATAELAALWHPSAEKLRCA